jgi:hypothetical protein
MWHVYVVVLEDPLCCTLFGVYATKEAAQRYIEMQDSSGEIVNMMTVMSLMKRSVQN